MLVILHYIVVQRGHTLAISDQVSNSATLLPARKGLPERNSIVIMQYNRAKQYTTLTMTLKILNEEITWCKKITRMETTEAHT